MEKGLKLAVVLLCASLLFTQHCIIKRTKAERDRYKTNTEVLIDSVQTFKTKAGYSAAKVGQLELTLKELKRLKSDDEKLIKELKGKKDLVHYITNDIVTEVPVTTEVHDTIVKRDSVYIPAKCIDWSDPWASLSGCFVGDDFSGRILVRESLVITEVVKRKRFLGFLWKTRKIKHDDWNVVSKNPHTEIVDYQVVKVKY